MILTGSMEEQCCSPLHRVTSFFTAVSVSLPWVVLMFKVACKGMSAPLPEDGNYGKFYVVPAHFWPDTFKICDSFLLN